MILLPKTPRFYNSKIHVTIGFFWLLELNGKFGTSPDEGVAEVTMIPHRVVQMID